jgi:acyl carrier protein
MITDELILERLQPIFDELFQESRPTVTMELSPSDVLEWDSLMNVQLMVAAERQFGVSISVVDIEGIRKVSDLVRLIRGKAS